MGCKVHFYRIVPDKAHARKKNQTKTKQENNESQRAYKITCRRASLLTKQVAGAKDRYVAQQGTTVKLTHATSVQGAWKHDQSITFAWLYTQFTEYFQGMN